MSTVALSLDEIGALARRVFSGNGCDEANTAALTRTIVAAERDICPSHGLFRVPGYVASLRSGKVRGNADPKVTLRTPAIVDVDGDNGYAPLALERATPALAEAANTIGVAVCAIRKTHHFAALWPEVEMLAQRGVIGLACTNYLPVVAPAGGKTPIFGTNPLAIAWPRPGREPVVLDMATSAMARGEVSVAARDGHSVPLGVGLDADGQPSTDPAAILKGVLLPFGGHKGSGLALMLELLSAGAIGERFSFESAAEDPGDGGPPRGGEFLLAISPSVLAGPGWEAHCESFFARFDTIEGARLPGERRHANRLKPSPRHIDAKLVEQVRSLA